MDGLQFLDLVIGMVFIYFLLSLICVSLQELKANIFNERSKDLEKWIIDTFNAKGQTESGLGNKIWKNKIIDGLTSEGKTASYIPKEAFVSALLDEIYYNSNDLKNQECAGDITKLLNYEIKEPYDFNTLLTAINDPSVCLPIPFQRVLRQIHAESHQNLETFRTRIERWFEMAMQRNTGIYKKKAQIFSLLSAMAVTISLNVDSIDLANYLYNNPAEAARIADIAESSLKDIENHRGLYTTSNETEKHIEEIRTYVEKVNSLELPIGWTNKAYVEFKKDGRSIFASITGWIITIFSVSLGAPFWFDTLNKLVNLRAAGKMPNGGSPPSSSDPNVKDSQTAVG